MKKYLFTLLFLKVIFACAQDTIALKEVHIQDYRVKTALDQHFPTQVIDQQALRKINAAQLADAVRTLPGVFVKDYGGIGGLKTISVRSLGAEHTAVAIDGMPITDAQTGQVDLGKIPIENVETITLSNGLPIEEAAAPQNYTPTSMLNIRTKNYQIDPSVPYRLAVSLQTGSFGNFTPSVYGYKKIKNKSFFAFHFISQNADGAYRYQILNGNLKQEATRQNSDISTLRLEANAGTDFKKSNIRFKTIFYDSDRGLPGAVILYNPAGTQRLYNTDFSAQTTYTFAPDSLKKLKIEARWAKNKLRYLDEQYLNMARMLDDRFSQNTFSTAVMVTFKHKYFHFSTGTDWTTQQLSATTYDFATPTRHLLGILLATKYERNRWTAETAFVHTFWWESTEKVSAFMLKNLQSVSLATSYKLLRAEALRFRISARYTYRLPTFNDMYFIRGNSTDIRPEKTTQYNAGLTFQKSVGFVSSVSISTDVFYGIITDRILAIPTKNLFIWSIRNVGKVQTYGVETKADVSFKPFGKLWYPSLSVSYTRSFALDKTDPYSPTFGDQIPYTPFENLFAGAALNYKKWLINYNQMYSGFRYSLGENIIQNYLPAWTTADVGITYQPIIFSKKCFIRLEINNLFDAQYELIRSFPMPLRNYRLTFKVNL